MKKRTRPLMQTDMVIIRPGRFCLPQIPVSRNYESVTNARGRVLCIAHIVANEPE